MTIVKQTLEGTAEIAAFLGLPMKHRTTITRWIETEALPAFQLAGRWYSDPDELARWWKKAQSRLQTTHHAG